MSHQLIEFCDFTKDIGFCAYCSTDNIDCSIYKQYGIGHTDDCILKDCYLDEDFGRWSEFHANALDCSPAYCKACGELLDNACQCHLNN